MYSIHQGRIDCDTKEQCLAIGTEIAFIDTVDIRYFNCIEVKSTTNKTLGYYLDIVCYSGNCERYKSENVN